MHIFFKFILLASFGAFVFLFVFSGFLGYFFYSNSNGNLPPEAPQSSFPDWDLMTQIPKEVLISGIFALAAIWALVGLPEQQEARKEPKKGRKRRYIVDEETDVEE